MEADSKSSSENVEMLDLQDEPSFQEERLDVTIETVQSRGSGRRPLPNRWTRVIGMDSAGSHEIQVYSVADDLASAPK